MTASSTKRVARMCSGVSGVIAASMAVQWITGHIEFSRFGTDSVPMAFETAVLLMALNALLLAASSSRLPRIRTWFAVLFALLVCVAVAASMLAAAQGDMASRLSNLADAGGHLRIGWMSPLTTLAFMLATVAMLAMLPRFTEHRVARGIAATAGLAIIAITTVVTMSYLVRMPLLYGSGNVPMALTTAIALWFHAIAVLFATSVGRWLEASTLPRWMLVTYALLLVLLVAGGTAVYAHLQQQFRMHAERDIAAVNYLKTRQLGQWWQEREADAHMLVSSPLFIDAVSAWMRTRDADAGRRLRTHLENVRMSHAYAHIRLVDARGVELLASTLETHALHDAVRVSFHEAVRTGAPTFSPLHAGDDLSAPHLDMFAPVRLRGCPDSIVVVALQVDARQHLYPVLRLIALPSRPVVDVLIGREGADAIVLDTQPQRKGASPVLRVPLDRADLAVVHAMTDSAGVFEARSTRGMRVLAAAYAVTGTPWMLLTEVDVDSIFAPLQRDVHAIGSITALLLLALTLGMVILQRDRRAAALHENIEAHRRSEAAMRKAKEAAERADRLKDAFIANISHEIRTPLNIIVGFIELLRSELDDRSAAELDPMFEGIDAGAERLMRTIDLILNVSRIEAGDATLNLARHDVRTVVTDLMVRMTPDADRKQVTLQFVDSCGDVRIRADLYYMQQVLANLLDNAIKFSSRGVVTTALSRTGARVHLTVTDTGIGISPDYLPKMFTPYSQEESGSTRPYDGIGLGLALVKRYLDLHGVPITVDSAKGRGTTVTLDLTPILDVAPIHDAPPVLAMPPILDPRA